MTACRFLLVFILLATCPLSVSAEETSVIALYNQANDLLYNGSLDQALEKAEQAIKLDPGYAPLWVLKARILYRREEYPGALAALHVPLQIDKDDVQACVLNLLTLFKMQKMGLAIPRGEPAAFIRSLDDSLAEPLLAALLDQTEATRDVIRFLHYWRPGTPKTRAVAHTLKQFFSGDAIAATQTALELVANTPGRDPLLGALCFYMGKECGAKQHNLQALKLLRAALGMGRDPVDVQGEIGWILYNNGEYEQAAQAWESHWREAPDVGKWADWIADARLHMGDVETALKFYQKSMQMDRNNPVVQGKYLCALLVSGDENKARSFIAKLERQDDKSGLHFGLACYYREKKEYNRALAEFKTIRNTKNFRVIYLEYLRNWLDHLTLSGDWAAQRAEILELLAGTREEAPMLRDIGWKLWEKKRYDDAATIWGDAVAKGLANKDEITLQAVLRLLEVNRTATALSFLREHAPHISPFGVGLYLVRGKRWDLVQKFFQNAPVKRYAALANLYLTRSLIENGQVRQAMILLGILDKQQVAVPAGTVKGFDKDGNTVSIAVSQSDVPPAYAGIAQAIVDKGFIDAFGFLPRIVSLARMGDAKAGTMLADAGKTLYRGGKREQAESFLRAALERDAHDILARLYLAAVCARQGLWEETERLLAVDTQNAPPADWEYVCGEIALMRNDVDAAVEHYSRALALTPDDALLRYQVVWLLVSLQHYTRAREAASWFETRYAAGDKGIRSYTAMCRYELGELRGAAQIWNELLQDYPDSEDYLAGLGRTLNQLNLYAETRKRLLPAFQKGGNIALGAILCEAGVALAQHADVAAWAERVLRTAPDDPRFLRFAAESSEFLGDYDAAARFAAHAFQCDPASGTMANLLGRMLVNKEQYPQAVEFYQGLLERNPRYEDALRSLLSVNQITGDAAQAFHWAGELRAAAPDDPGVQLKYAVAAAGAQDFPEAFPPVEALYGLGTKDSVLVLYYPHVRACDAGGVQTLAAWEEQMRALKARGCSFAGLADFKTAAGGDTMTLANPPAGPGKAVLILVGRTCPDTLRAMDAILQDIQGRAVFVAGEESLTRGTPLYPDIDGLRQLLGTGRWDLALTDYSPPPLPQTQDREHGGYWRNAAPGEDEEQMTQRLRERLRSFASRAASLHGGVIAWMHPQELSENRILDVDPAALNAYGRALRDVFRLAFSSDPEGFWTPMAQPLRLPCRNVPPYWDARALLEHLDYRNPLTQAVVELAKICTWHNQLERAAGLYREAEALGVNPRELALNQGINAYYQGDVPTSLRLLAQADKESLDSETARRMYRRARLATRPTVEPEQLTSWDSDNRLHHWIGSVFGGHVSDSLLLYGRAGYLDWSLDDAPTGSMEHSGAETALGARWYFYPEYRLSLEGALTLFDKDIAPFMGATASLHAPIDLSLLNINGTYDLELSRERIETVEAVSEEIHAHRGSLMTHVRFMDYYDLFTNMHALLRTDANNTFIVDGRVLRRLFDAPLLQLGYAYQYGNSDWNPEEYWAPEDLQTHLAYLSVSHTVADWLRVVASTAYGPSKSKARKWQQVWRANLENTISFSDRFNIDLKYSYFQTPTYTMNQFWSGLEYIF